MRKVTTAIVTGSAALSLLLAACSGGGDAKPVAAQKSDAAGGAATLALQDIKYDKTTLTATKGQTLTVTITNGGALEHDFTIDKIDAKATLDGKDAKSDKAAVHAVVKPKASGKLELTPASAGTFDFYCTVAGHKEAGMKGTLTVN